MPAIILSSLRFLARQGLALRNAEESSSNLIQLLRLRAEDHPQLTSWLERSQKKYTSHENQNEMLEIMAHHFLRKILGDVETSPFLALMVDETADIANKEQLVIRWIDKNLNVNEEFLGMYCLQRTTAESITSAIKDALLRFQIPISKVRGQCYDGCSTMAGARGGVAAKIQQLEPRAVFTHCYGHALNLSVSDTVKQSVAMRDCLDTCYEIIKLIKFSPMRDARLKSMKEETGSDAPSIRTLCPTRWTVRAQSLASIIGNYQELQQLWEEAPLAVSDTAMKARIRGVATLMTSFQFLFSLHLSEMILQHTDKLSQTLQNPQLSSAEGHEIAMLTVRTLQSIRSDSSFELFWLKVEQRRENLEVEEARLRRKRKIPKRYEQGDAEAEFHATAKDSYRQVYFEALDLSITSINSRFDQPGFKVYLNVEELLLKACAGKPHEEELACICIPVLWPRFWQEGFGVRA